MYAKWRATQEKAAGASGMKDSGKGDANAEKSTADDEATMLIDDSTKVFSSVTGSKM